MALQIALLIPLIAALLGLVQGFRMTRLPDPEPSAGGEEMMLGLSTPSANASIPSITASNRIE